MRDDGDYLFGKTGAPVDAEVAALEQALRPLRHDGRALPIARLQAMRQQQPRRVAPWWLALAAAAAAVALTLLFARGEPELAPGAAARTFATKVEKHTIRLGELASIELAPATELEFSHWLPGEARFRLRRGAVAVRVAPPPAVAPRFFCIDTPRGSVVDLGCRYDLEVRGDGSEHVRVTEGLVEFALPRRGVSVPAGASCVVQGDWPSTPLFAETAGMLRDFVGKFDAMTRDAVEPQLRAEVAEKLVSVCGSGRDTLVLWHLLHDELPAVRAAAEQRLLEIEGEPPGAEPATKLQPAHAEPAVWLAFLQKGAWQRAR